MTKHVVSHDILQAILNEVIAIAKSAGELIESYRHADVEIMHKGLGGGLAADVVTEVDLRCQAFIESRLAPLSEQYSIAFIGEESTDHSARFEKPYSWLVDPIDGTLAFIEKREGYSVSIALIDCEGEPLLGVVYNPFRSSLYAAAKGCAVIVDNRCFSTGESAEGKEELGEPEKLDEITNTALDRTGLMSCFLDRSYENDSRYTPVLENLERYAIQQGYDGVELNAQFGAALNACSVLRARKQGNNAIYFKLPKEKGGSIWDYAASAAIFTRLNLPVSDLYGAPLDLNRKDSTYLNHRGFIYASDTELYQWILQCIA